MKKTLAITLSLLFVLLCFASCNKIPAEGLWENATYRKDKTFGDGAKTVQVEVKVEEQSVTFTLNTDKETLGDALLEHDEESFDGFKHPPYPSLRTRPPRCASRVRSAIYQICHR